MGGSRKKGDNIGPLGGVPWGLEELEGLAHVHMLTVQHEKLS